MYVVHLEHNEAIRDRLERLLGVQSGALGDCRYLSTEAPSDLRRVLRTDQVKALILDVGLNPAWDNHHLLHVLRHLALDEELASGERAADCVAYGLTMLAHRHHVPSALLTNYADFTGGDPPLTEQKLCDAFQVQAIFHKDGDGLNRCARWVCQVLETP